MVLPELYYDLVQIVLWRSVYGFEQIVSVTALMCVCVCGENNKHMQLHVSLFRSLPESKYNLCAVFVS